MERTLSTIGHAKAVFVYLCSGHSCVCMFVRTVVCMLTCLYVCVYLKGLNQIGCITESS